MMELQIYAVFCFLLKFHLKSFFYIGSKKGIDKTFYAFRFFALRFYFRSLDRSGFGNRCPNNLFSGIAQARFFRFRIISLLI